MAQQGSVVKRNFSASRRCWLAGDVNAGKVTLIRQVSSSPTKVADLLTTLHPEPGLLISVGSRTFAVADDRA
jgi:GTPase involved in cell partitioning and DNA repair